jgi:hypothetical protein
MRPALPALSTALILGTLAATAACDKTPKVDPNQVLPAGVEPLDLSVHPQILFQVFGDVKEPKIMPIAAVVKGAVRPLALTRAGWRELDSTYLAAGTKYDVYVDDAPAGTVTVTRGMWNGGDSALYPLPGCRDLRPLGVATLEMKEKSADPTVEVLAAAQAIPPHAGKSKPFPPRDAIAKMGRDFGHALGERAQMDKAELDSLDFIARMMITGARPDATLLVSFIDQQAGDIAPGVGHTSHMLALFDKVDTGYVATYRHIASGDAKGVEFQRIMDHLDVTGDGTDEIFLESWHYGGNNDLVVLAFKADQWHEAMRTPSKWCLDPPKPDKK